MDEAQVLSDRVVIISYGKIIADGTPSELILKHGGKTTLIVEDGRKEAYDVLKAKFPKARMENGDVLVPINDKSDLPNAVMALNDKKAKFGELIVRRPNLEDVFLNLTGKKMVDGELN
jgi:ABC-2 type transport system ATP-binding protein